MGDRAGDRRGGSGSRRGGALRLARGRSLCLAAALTIAVCCAGAISTSTAAGAPPALARAPAVLLQVDAKKPRSLGQDIALLAGILFVAVAVLRLGLRRRSGRRAGEPSARSTSGSKSAERGKTPVGELEEILVQIRETGREIESRLDTKIRFAQRLLLEAEEALGKLELARARATDAAERIEAGEPPRGSGATRGKKSGGASAATRAASADVPPVRERIAAPSPVPDPPSKPSAEPRTRPIPPEQRSQERIRALAAEGRDANQIAREVGRPIGEVQLILALGRGESPEVSEQAP